MCSLTSSLHAHADISGIVLVGWLVGGYDINMVVIVINGGGGHGGHQFTFCAGRHQLTVC